MAAALRRRQQAQLGSDGGASDSGLDPGSDDGDSPGDDAPSESDAVQERGPEHAAPGVSPAAQAAAAAAVGAAAGMEDGRADLPPPLHGGQRYASRHHAALSHRARRLGLPPAPHRPARSFLRPGEQAPPFLPPDARRATAAELWDARWEGMLRLRGWPTGAEEACSRRQEGCEHAARAGGDVRGLCCAAG